MPQLVRHQARQTGLSGGPVELAPTEVLHPQRGARPRREDEILRAATGELLGKLDPQEPRHDDPSPIVRLRRTEDHAARRGRRTLARVYGGPVAPFRRPTMALTVDLVDSASLYAVYETLSFKDPSDCHKWAWSSSVEVACVIIGSSNVRIAPSPNPAGYPTGPYEVLCRTLGIPAGTTRPPDMATKTALKKTKRWVRDNARGMSADYQRMLRDALEFQE